MGSLSARLLAAGVVSAWFGGLLAIAAATAGAASAPGPSATAAALGAALLGALLTQVQALPRFCAPGARAAAVTALLLAASGGLGTALAFSITAQAARARAQRALLEPGTHRWLGRVTGTTCPLPRGVTTVEGHIVPDAGRPPAGPGAPLRVRGCFAEIGAQVRLVVRVGRAESLLTPSPELAWPRARGEPFGDVVRVLEVAPPGHGPRGPSAAAAAEVIERARAAVRRAFVQTLSPPNAELAAALVLGDTGVWQREELTLVRASGLAHVVAVSGMHITVVLALVFRLLAALVSRTPALARRHDPRRLASLLAIPLCPLLGALTGGGPSAWRAALTALAVHVLHAAGRTPNLTAVTLAVVQPFLWFAPLEATRPGFALSVVATLAVARGTARGEHGPRHERPAALLRAFADEFVLPTARATLATLPLLLLCFRGVPLLTLAANVATLPVVALGLLPTAFAHAALASTPLAPLTGAAFSVFADAFHACLQLFGRSPALAVPPPTAMQTVGMALGALGAVFVSRTARPWMLAAGLLLVLAGEWRVRHAERPRGEVRITAVDVGQGDATLVDLPDGRLLAIDAGPGPQPEEVLVPGSSDPSANAWGASHPLVALLRARRRSTLDVLVVTHGHPDHYGGLYALLAHTRVRELWYASQAVEAAPTGEFVRLLSAFARTGTRLRSERELCAGVRVFGTALVEVRAPCPAFDPAQDLNDNSLVLLLTWAGQRALFAGDVEAAREEELLGTRSPGPVALLKVPHHGSRTSSSARFLAWAKPAAAWVSAGAENRFGHPHPEVMRRLAAFGVRAFVTARSGGCVFRFASAGVVAECARGKGHVEQ